MPADNVLALPSDTFAPGVARRFVSERSTLLARDVISDALVVVSELVTNAVLHGRPAVTLTLRISASELHVAVHDCGAELPPRPPTRPPHIQVGGRGLLIVDALATSWGVSPDQAGKSVWFALSLPAPAA